MRAGHSALASRYQSISVSMIIPVHGVRYSGTCTNVGALATRLAGASPSVPS